MDVLYVVGPHRDGFSLRMSLRSLEANAANVGRIVVAGDPPDWLADDVVRVPCDSPCHRKQMNILRSVFRAMETGAVPGPALYSSDDHFMIAPHDLDAFPWFSNGILPSYELFAVKGKPVNPYRGSLAATYDLLKFNGYPHDLKLSGHVNTHIDGRHLEEAVKLVGEYWKTPWGYEPSEVFGSIARKHDPDIVTVKKYDSKIAQPTDTLGVEIEVSKGRGFISCAPAALAGGALKGWLLSRFPGKSRWER